MGVLLIRCPTFGIEFSTGVETDAHSLELIPDTAAQSQCPYCGIRHAWSKRDVRLSDNGLLSEKVAAVG
jgi:hypothetical protein